jgi:hypothetical protein
VNAQSAPTDQTTQPPKALRADAQRNIERLLEAARAAIAKDGPDASLDDIARDAGVGSGTFVPALPLPAWRCSRRSIATRSPRLCAKGDRLLESDTEPGEALAEWLRVYVSFGAMKRGLMGPLTTALGQDSDLFSTCKTMVRATGGRLVEASTEGRARSATTSRSATC